MPEALTIASADRRSCPTTSTRSTEKRPTRSSHRNSHPAPAASVATTRAAPPHSPTRRASRRARRRRRSSRCPVMAASGSARSPRAAPRGERTALRPLMPCSTSLVPHDADLGLEGEPEVVLHPLARDLHEAQDVRGGGAAPVHDEVGVLGRDLGAVVPLALQADLLDEAGRQLALRILPHASRRGEGERLRRFLLLEALTHVLLYVRLGPAMELQPRAH